MLPVRLLRGPLGSAEADQVRSLVALAEQTDGVEPLGEQTLLDLTDPAAVHVLADDGDLVAYGQLGPRHGESATIELVVAPDSRCRGLGSSLVEQLLAHARTVDHPVRLWTHGSLPGSRVLAQAHGLVPVRELWRMAAELGPSDPGAGEGVDAALPAPATLRAFVPGRDESAWLAANAAAFAHHPEQGSLGPADLAARMAEPWFDPGDLLLADGPDGLLGFAWCKVVPPEGELYALGVVPAAQGVGLGRALTRAALDHLRARGVEHAVLFTDADNAAAVRTYIAAGFVTDRVDTQYALPESAAAVPD